MKEAELTGLKVYAKKTKLMVINAKEKQGQVCIQEEAIEITDQTIYLGQLISKEGGISMKSQKYLNKF